MEKIREFKIPLAITGLLCLTLLLIGGFGAIDIGFVSRAIADGDECEVITVPNISVMPMMKEISHKVVQEGIEKMKNEITNQLKIPSGNFGSFSLGFLSNGGKVSYTTSEFNNTSSSRAELLNTALILKNLTKVEDQNRDKAKKYTNTNKSYDPMKTSSQTTSQGWKTMAQTQATLNNLSASNLRLNSVSSISTGVHHSYHTSQ